MAITKLPRSGIKDNAINASKIEDGTVAAAEISGTVSAAKLNSTLDISGKTVTLPNTSVTSGMLANTTIANAKLANSTFTIRGTSRALGASFNLGIDVDWQSVVVSDGSTVTTMVAGRGYFVNNTSAAGIVKLPASAVIGDTIVIKDYAGNFGTNNYRSLTKKSRKFMPHSCHLTANCGRLEKYARIISNRPRHLQVRGNSGNAHALDDARSWFLRRSTDDRGKNLSAL